MINIDTIQITPTILRLIAHIDEFNGKWRVIGNLHPEWLNSLRHIATIESVGSSTRIEGATLSDKEVEVILSGVGVQTYQSRDEQEVAGYEYVMQEIFASWRDIPFTENYIKQLHAMLLRYSDKDVRHRGEYKKFPNHVEAFDASGKSLGIIFHTATPFETPQKMHELIHWTRTALEDKILHPLLVIGIFAVVFLAIHPFQDGNGRLSRILTTLLLLQSGYSYVVYSSLESIVEANKDSYYLALRRTQATLKDVHPDWAPWLVFFLHTLHEQTRRLQKKIDDKNEYKP